MTEAQQDAPVLTGLPSAAVEVGVAVPSAMVARRLLRLGWRKATGEEPPEHPERAQGRSLVQTLLWVVAVAAVAAAARALAWRAVLGLRGGAPAGDGSRG